MPKTYTVHTDKTVNETRRDIAEQVQTWCNDGAKRIEWSLELNVPVARQFTRSLTREERAATLYLHFADGREIVWSADSQETPASNARLLRIAIERLRLIEKAGLSELMRSALLQLDAPHQVDPWQLFGLRPDADRTVVDAVYRQLAKERHPDHGGTDDAFRELDDARHRIYEQRGWAA